MGGGSTMPSRTLSGAVTALRWLGLEELHEALYEHAQEARGAFYRAAFGQHARAGLDPEVHQLGLQPDHSGEAAARAARILGRSFPADLRGLIRGAAGGLLSVGTGDDDARMWRLVQAKRLTDLARRELSDSQVAIHQAIGQILIKPELRG